MFFLLESKKLANTKNLIKLMVVFYTVGLSPFKIKNTNEITSIVSYVFMKTIWINVTLFMLDVDSGKDGVENIQSPTTSPTPRARGIV